MVIFLTIILLLYRLLGYQYYGPGVHQPSGGGDYGNTGGKDHISSPNSVDYIADQFQGMSFGPHHMYPMVPVTMAMDHPMQGYPMHHSGPGQYPGGRMYPHYSTGHTPSIPSPVSFHNHTYISCLPFASVSRAVNLLIHSIQ